MLTTLVKTPGKTLAIATIRERSRGDALASGPWRRQRTFGKRRRRWGSRSWVVRCAFPDAHTVAAKQTTLRAPLPAAIGSGLRQATCAAIAVLLGSWPSEMLPMRKWV
jgi:hypothetical protein